MKVSLQRCLPTVLCGLMIGPSQLVLGQFQDNFSDGDYTNDPTWSGDTDLFTIADDGGDLRLRSNNPGAATYHLSTPSTLAADAQWEFFLNLRFATSGANYVDAYLMSPQADLNPRPEGYFVRMGDTQDHIVLYKRVGTTNTALVSSAGSVLGSSTNNPFRIRVTRDLDNNWTLAYQSDGTGTFTTAGTAVDNTFNTSTHFGILIVQSTAASAVNNHFFDDFIVSSIPVDEAPPVISAIDVQDALNIDVLFNEPVDIATAQTVGNYGLSPTVVISSALLDVSDPSRVRLALASPMQNGTTYTLTVTGVQDLVGNATDNASGDFLYFVPDVPVYRDVVINEVMVDPSPPLGLPDAEYIELFNATTDKFFDLAGWRITTSSTSATLPNYALGPGQHILLVSTANHPQFSFVPNSEPFGLSTTALVNGGTTVTLEGPGGIPLDVVPYSLSWYQDSNRDDGGWSLEQINPFDPCSGQLNWRASNSIQGGTPGLPNSVLDPTPDTQAPSLLQVLTLQEDLIELVFSEGMDAVGIANGTYTITPPLPIAQITGLPPTNQRVQLLLDQAMEPGVVYTLSIAGATDCPGNAIGSNNSAQFALPEIAEPGDVVINEVLSNPITTSGEYVEVYNRSNKVLSLQGWQMANESDGVVANPRTISAEPLLFFPGEYFLFTRNTGVTASQFPQGRSARFVTVDLPSYTNASGTVVLLNDQGTVMDLYRYNEDQHFPLLRSVKGVSLERQDPERATDDPTNWHSAAENVGFGTPGYQNSQFAPAPAPTGELTIDPAIFSPDNDGYQDVLTITYRFDQPGSVGTMSVFDIAGREVRRLLDSQLLGTSGTVAWDGVLNSGSKGRMGPYIILFEVYDLNGNQERFKKTVTLAHQLD
ncbi:MAG: lamin tail domain-containing protein [Flavobacteriales bacterium]